MRRLPSLLAFALVLSSALQADGPASLPAATTFPKENPGAVYPELKIYDTRNNPIRVPTEDWAGAAARVAADPSWAKWVRGQRTEVDHWMAQRRDRVDWVAGWFHDFVSPKDASELIFTPDEPGPETLKSRSDPKVELTPKLHAAWVFFFRGDNAGKMLQAARLYRLTGDKKYADWAASQLDFYADNYSRWVPPKPFTHLTFQPLDEASLVADFVQTAQTLGDGWVGPKRRQHWIDALFKPEADLLQKSEAHDIINNRACWEWAAVGEIALYAKDEDLWRRAIDGPFGIHDQIARGVTGDYLWYEQSLHYNNYVVSALTPLFADAQMAGRGAELQEDMETVEDLMLTPAEMRFPTGQLPNPADGGRAEHAPDAKLWSGVASLYPTAIGVYELAHEKSWQALLDPPDPATVPAEEPPLPTVISRLFGSSGMAVIRRGPWQVYLHYGQITASHVQAEALNYEAFFNDIDVTQDPGTVGYGSPMTNNYYRTGVCHNVPLVDGVGQIPEKTHGQPYPRDLFDPAHRGRLDAFSGASVSASQPKYQPAASADRTLTIDGDVLRDTVHLATTDGQPHALGFLLHLMGKAERLPSVFVPDPNPERIQPVPGFKYWKDASRATFHDRAEFDVKIGSMTMRVDFELPGDFTVWHASAPDLLPRRRDVFYLETHGREATLRTTLRPAASSGAQSSP